MDEKERPPGPPARVVPLRAGRRHGGDATVALERVYRQEYTNLVALARLLLDRQAEAEEVVQEAFVRAFAGWHRIEQRDDPTRYLRRTVVNIARDGLRRRGTVRRTPLEPAGVAAGADVAVILTESQREVGDALRALPDRQRECVVLRYLLECSTAETAAVLGVSAGSVKTHLSRGLAALEAALEATR